MGELTSGTPLIQVQGLKKDYGSGLVLRDLNFSVTAGEVVAIIGASGCGKSTLVRCIAGLEGISGGRILLSGAPINGTGETKGKIGMVFQNFNLFPHYRTGENISKPLQTIRGLCKENAVQRAKELLEKVRLSEKFEEYPNSLSGGQRQRVAIARALAMEPEIMIFDEPTSSLDPELSHEVFETIRGLAQEGQTMLLVTHQINAVRRFASRVVFLSNGQIEEEGTAEFILEKCQNENLRRFLKQVKFEDL